MSNSRDRDPLHDTVDRFDPDVLADIDGTDTHDLPETTASTAPLRPHPGDPSERFGPLAAGPYTIDWAKQSRSQAENIRLIWCPACEARLAVRCDVANHLTKHDPEDFGLSPMRHD